MKLTYQGKQRNWSIDFCLNHFKIRVEIDHDGEHRAIIGYGHIECVGYGKNKTAAIRNVIERYDQRGAIVYSS